MEDHFECTLKSSFLDRKRKLIINTDYIEYEDNDLFNGSNTKFNKDEIASFRYGISWINGYKFTIGRIYCIEIKNNTSEVIKLKLKSIYGIRKKELHQKYASIVNSLIDFQFMDIAKTFINEFRKGNEFNLVSIRILNEGIQLKSKKIILWEDLQTKQYYNKYSLSSKTNKNIYTLFEYTTDWNTAVLYSVIEQILIDKKEKPYN